MNDNRKIVEVLRVAHRRPNQYCTFGSGGSEHPVTQHHRRSIEDTLRFNFIIAVVAALAGGIASIAGFGIGSLLTPLVAVEYEIKTAVAAVAIPHVIATILRFWRLRVHVDRQVVIGFGLMNAVGSLVGSLVHI